MTLDALAGRLSPDFPETLKRFPFAIVLAGVATLVIVALTTEAVRTDAELWVRIAMGLGTAAIFAVGGALFAATRKRGSPTGLIVAYAVPIAVFAAWQVTSTTWLIPWALPVIGTLWTSVAASTAGWRGPARVEAQDRFWWLNHLAITSGAIAGVGYLIILIGTFAIGQTVDTLFGVDLSLPLYRIALPVIGGFFVPLYWLSTLPHPAGYTPSSLEAPDFLIRAVAMIGKFVLIPLLLAYAAILLIYAAQIVVTQQLPQGTLGWMVLGFVVTGAGTWLVLHPEFLRDSVIIRFFRRWWFWSTIVPLVLYFTAVQVRIDAYGYTPERLLLIWGGVWATALTALFLLRRGDIRLVPILAAICLLLATVGPWNVFNLSRVEQAATFDNLLPLTGPNGESYGVTPDWTPEEAARAKSAVDFLVQSEEGREALRRVVYYKGFDLQDGAFSTDDVMRAIGVSTVAIDPSPGYTLSRDTMTPVDVSATPFYVGELALYRENGDAVLLDLGLSIGTDTLRISRDGVVLKEVDLKPWFTAPDMATLSNPFVAFDIDGRHYRLLVDTLALLQVPDSDGLGGQVHYLMAKLFAGPIPPAPPPAALPTAPDQPAPAT